MKLYATVSSERASKGQGGEWLDIDIHTTDRSEPSHRIEVRESKGEITISLSRRHFGRWYGGKVLDTVFVNYEGETKGEQQKGETLEKCTHGKRVYGRCPECGYLD